jgi:hypothetical protein
MPTLAGARGDRGGAAGGRGAAALLLEQAGGSVRDALMLTRFSGLDIVAELRKLVDAPRFDAAAAYKVADGVAARDDGARFTVFNDAVLGRISELAREAAVQGRLGQAAALVLLAGCGGAHRGDTGLQSRQAPACGRAPAAIARHGA